jgi:hypothetical protein
MAAIFPPDATPRFTGLTPDKSLSKPSDLLKPLALCCCACFVVGCRQSAVPPTPELLQHAAEQREAAEAKVMCAREGKVPVPALWTVPDRQGYTHYRCVTPEQFQQAEQREAAQWKAKCATQGKVAVPASAIEIGPLAWHSRTPYVCVTPEELQEAYESPQQAKLRAAANAEATCAKEGKVAKRDSLVSVLGPVSHYELERLAYHCHSNGDLNGPIQSPMK